MISKQVSCADALNFGYGPLHMPHSEIMVMVNAFLWSEKPHSEKLVYETSELHDHIPAEIHTLFQVYTICALYKHTRCHTNVV